MWQPFTEMNVDEQDVWTLAWNKKVVVDQANYKIFSATSKMRIVILMFQWPDKPVIVEDWHWGDAFLQYAANTKDSKILMAIMANFSLLLATLQIFLP